MSGVYDGGTVTVPMGNVPAIQPHGLDGAVLAAEDPAAAFGAFVVTHTPCMD